MFVLIAATAGVGGGNFASSMANINFFYPAKRKGLALGLNAAGGNIGVAVIQLGLPIVVGGAGLFGLVAGERGRHPPRARGLPVRRRWPSSPRSCAFLFMDNLSSARSSRASSGRSLKHRHTWVMSFLYIGTFGSFIGYSAALPLLIKLNFYVPTPAPRGHRHQLRLLRVPRRAGRARSRGRSAAGWPTSTAARRVTLATFAAMIVGTLGVLAGPLSPARPPQPGRRTPRRSRVDNTAMFPWFLVAFLFVFAATGIGNGSTYRMIPAIWKAERPARPTPRASQARPR